jgi:ribosomal protein S12 methylthiotransferase
VRVHLVSLGCPKNLVDSEVILGRLGSEGFVVAPDAEDAEVIVVNTCGFVESAKEESIQTILEACELKKASGGKKKVVVAGCLTQRYGPELREEIPEVDAFVGLGEYEDLGAALRELVAGGTERYYRVSDPTKACNAEVGRVRLTPPHYAYLRISEGCDNPCTFCAIPKIRGRFRSKPIAMLEAEAHELVSSGARELVLISQDTTSYGADIDGRFQLPRLLERLSEVEGLEWIRILYAYPAFFTDEMTAAVATLDKVVKYVDMPLQHISNTMLRHMGRRLMEAKTRELLDRMRERIPGLYLRTTFIVGFPGEDEREFAVLREFVRDFQFERLGVFEFSPEDGTPAAGFADAVPSEVRRERFEELMLVQQEVAFRKNRERVGEATEVLVDAGEETASTDGVRARSSGEAPEIDPCIFVRRGPGRSKGRRGKAPERREAHAPSRRARGSFVELPVLDSESNGSAARSGLHPAPLRTGDRVRVRIVGSEGYDLVAVPETATTDSEVALRRP